MLLLKHIKRDALPACLKRAIIIRQLSVTIVDSLSLQLVYEALIYWCIIQWVIGVCAYLAWLWTGHVERQLAGVTSSLAHRHAKKSAVKVLELLVRLLLLQFSISCKRRCCSMVQGTALEQSDRANHPLDAGHGEAGKVSLRSIRERQK